MYIIGHFLQYFYVANSILIVQMQIYLQVLFITFALFPFGVFNRLYF